uniref:Uncharacterized protein n=1 Tax=Timema bartmani TaxID=61472 RepID=A0A7R9I1W9_9NEOP|nr:unnamed protein product [Timema bartmani]
MYSTKHDLRVIFMSLFDQNTTYYQNPRHTTKICETSTLVDLTARRYPGGLVCHCNYFKPK